MNLIDLQISDILYHIKPLYASEDNAMPEKNFAAPIIYLDQAATFPAQSKRRWRGDANVY
jgi:hypothetical protein